MPESDAADFFLKQYEKDEDIARDIAGAFHQAALALPPLPSGERPAAPGGVRGSEFHVLGVPTGPAGERFAEHARVAMKDVELNVAIGSDDILFYRESPLSSLENLPQLGPKFQQAYQEMSAQQNFTPHSREDITNWSVVRGQ
jgi:hypothetical protein